MVAVARPLALNHLLGRVQGYLPRSLVSKRLRQFRPSSARTRKTTRAGERTRELNLQVNVRFRGVSPGWRSRGERTRPTGRAHPSYGPLTCDKARNTARRGRSAASRAAGPSRPSPPPRPQGGGEEPRSGSGEHSAASGGAGGSSEVALAQGFTSVRGMISTSTSLPLSSMVATCPIFLLLPTMVGLPGLTNRTSSWVSTMTSWV